MYKQNNYLWNNLILNNFYNNSFISFQFYCVNVAVFKSSFISNWHFPQ